MEPWIWAIIIAAFLILEFVTYQMVSIWLAIGCLGGLVLSFIPGVSWWVEVLVSLALALILLAFTRKIVMKWIMSRETKTNVDAMAGVETRLLTAITREEHGTVKIADVMWNASSLKPIKQGTLVKITKVDGNKLLVEAIEEEVVKEEPKIKIESKPKTETELKKTTTKKTGGKKK